MPSQNLPPQHRVAVPAPHRSRSVEWERRNLRLTPLEAVSLDASFADPPDALVLDLAASDMAAQAECWQVHDLLQIPLIVVRSDSCSDGSVALLERGADEVLAAGVEPALLAATVAAVLRRAQRQTVQGMMPVIRWGETEIDLVKRVVHRAGAVQSLSRTEYRLLVALLRAKGRACTHCELITQVWGANCATATHYLRLYIRYLREKIEVDPRHPQRIINVWGTGYRLLPVPSEEPTRESHPAGPTGPLLPRAEVVWNARSLSSPQPRQTSAS